MTLEIAQFEAQFLRKQTLKVGVELGEPVGEPVTDLAPSISEPTETGTGSRVSPKSAKNRLVLV